MRSLFRKLKTGLIVIIFTYIFRKYEFVNLLPEIFLSTLVKSQTHSSSEENEGGLERRKIEGQGQYSHLSYELPICTSGHFDWIMRNATKNSIISL